MTRAAREGELLTVEAEATAASEPARHTPAAKLARPALPGSCLERPALQKRLDEAFGRRLTTVVGGAGFGKSTLVAAWAADIESAWYTIDASDRSLGTLAGGLADALRLRDMDSVAHGSGSDDEGRAVPLGGALCQRLEERLASDLFLVLDDLHELPADLPSVRLIEALVRQAPPLLHLVLCSRTKPPFRVARLRGQGQVLSLDASDLAFSKDEIAELLATELGSDERAGDVFELTAGWPAAVRLAVEALRGDPDDRDRALASLRRREGPLFDYLAEEAFAASEPGVRELLRRVAYFDRFSPALCEALGLEGAAETSRLLVQSGLFVQAGSTSDGWLVLHELVRDFVRDRWPLDEDALHALQARAAAWFEARGELERALRSLAESSDHGELVRFLREHGADILASGGADAVIRHAEQLPAELRDGGLELLVGEAHRTRGDLDAALDHFWAAAGDADELRAGLAWRIGLVFDPSDPQEALRVYSLGRIEREDTPDEAILLARQAAIRVSQASFDVARPLAARALAAAEACQDPTALAHVHNVLGVLADDEADGDGAIAHFRAANQWADRAGYVRQLIIGRSNIADVLTERAKYVPALEELEEAIRLAESTGFHLLLPLRLSNRGDVHLGLGLVDQAMSDYEESIATSKAMGELGYGGFAQPGLGDAYRIRGFLGLARVAYEEAVAVGEHRRPLLRRLGQAGLARVIVGDEPVLAGTLAEHALAGEPLAREALFSTLAAGWVALARDEREPAEALALEAARVAHARGNPAGIAEALELQAMSAPESTAELLRLEEALGIWNEIGNPLRAAQVELALARLSDPPDDMAAERARRRLRRLGVRASAAGAAGLLMALGPEHPPPLEIQALGAFRVLRDGMPVPASEWQSRKARELLKLLVARQGHPVPRDQLLETLWPGEAPAKTSNRLSVALSTVRSVLDPAHAHPPDHFLRSSDDALTLDRVVCDTEAFEAEAEAGLAALRDDREAEAVELLEAAESAYSGDFLEEDLYAEWAAPVREQLRATYIAVTRALAQGSADSSLAARYYLRLLERDPYDEQAHLGLVGAHAAARSHGEARRSYRAYVNRMEELGVEPASFPAPSRSRHDTNAQ